MELPTPNTSINTTPAPTKRRGGRWAWVGAILLILVGGAIIIYPFVPKIEFALTKKQAVFPYESRLESKGVVNPKVTLTKLPVSTNKKLPTPTKNRLVIPSIKVDMEINEGPTEKVLDLGGIWHIPNTSNPLQGGNTVLSGHRWEYLPPSSRTLYLLDKVKIGEPVIVYWKGVEYDYRISKTEIVNPTDVQILNNTEQPQLTIFTCTPLFSTKHRLVLYGQLIS